MSCLLFQKCAPCTYTANQREKETFMLSKPTETVDTPRVEKRKEDKKHECRSVLNTAWIAPEAIKEVFPPLWISKKLLNVLRHLLDSINISAVLWG